MKRAYKTLYVVECASCDWLVRASSAHDALQWWPSDAEKALSVRRPYDRAEVAALRALRLADADAYPVRRILRRQSPQVTP